MSSPPKSSIDPRQQVLAALDGAEWHYDDEIDEMEIVLPGGAGREGLAVLVADEFYVRVDPDTFEPLSLLIPAYTSWLAKQPAAPTARPSTNPSQWINLSRQTARHAIRRTVRASSELQPMG